MPVAISGNMRIRSTARLKRARLKNFRLGATMKDVVTTDTTNHYPWTMTLGVKPLDAGLTEDGWTAASPSGRLN